MSVVLDVNVLPRGSASRTRKLRDAFMETYHATHAGVERVAVDLAADHGNLPVFDEWDIQAKFEMLYGEGRLDEQTAERWTRLTGMTDALHAADLLVVSAPMWNFSIPWHLKRWFDAVVQPRLTFEVQDGAYRGLLQGRTAVVLTTRDGAYAAGTPYHALDLQLPYLRSILGFMGYGPVHEVVAEPMALAGPAVAQEALLAACERARALARTLVVEKRI
jgi:FMN-dependent NADH-azoreductase